MENSDLHDRLERCIKNIESAIESSDRDMQSIIKKLGNIAKDIKGEEEQPGKVEERINVAYYIDPALIRKLKILGVKLDRDLPDLINEAISNFLADNDI